MANRTTALRSWSSIWQHEKGTSRHAWMWANAWHGECGTCISITLMLLEATAAPMCVLLLGRSC